MNGIMAGVQGFEPWNGGIRIRCLTAWLYPNMYWNERFGTGSEI